MNIKEKTFHFYCLLILVSILFLQSSVYAQKTGTVSGTIIDQNTKSPIPNFGVALFNIKDSTQTRGASSDEKGNFSIANIPIGNYFIIAGG